jgi:tribbles-like protein
MLSLPVHLLQRVPDQSEQTLEHASTLARPPPPLPFPAGSQLLSVGSYLVNLSAREADHHPSLDLRSRELLNCKVYPLKVFQHLAPLVYSEIEGVHRVVEVTKQQDEVFVFSPRPFGDLHNFLKQRRKLKEGLAARIFRQIVTLVRDAHRKHVVLRDLKLKKFVFEDREK